MKNSRMDRYEKQRRNTQSINVLIFLGAGLILLLLLLFTFGKADEENDNNLPTVNTGETEEDNLKADEENNNNFSASKANQTNEENEDNLENDRNDSQVEAEITALPVEDENVISAFTKNWDPIGTEQSEPHEMKFDKDSKDWEEMEQALKLATELEDLIIWWLGNDGEQKAVGTVTSVDQSEIYRVYISWIQNEGWQPSKVEVLLENDKHPDYKAREE